MSRALLRRLEQVEAMLGASEEPIVLTLISLGPDGRERVQTIATSDQRELPTFAPGAKTGAVRMVQITPDGREQVLEIGPAPPRGGNGRAKRRNKGGRHRGSKTSS